MCITSICARVYAQTPYKESMCVGRCVFGVGEGGHYEAIARTQPDSVHNLIGMIALVMWPKLLQPVKLDCKVIF